MKKKLNEIIHDKSKLRNNFDSVCFEKKNAQFYAFICHQSTEPIFEIIDISKNNYEFGVETSKLHIKNKLFFSGYNILN